MASTIELLLLAQASGTPRPVAEPWTPSAQTFTTTSNVTVGGLTAALGIGTYKIALRAYWLPAGTIGSSHHHGFTFGGTVASALFNAVAFQATSTSTLNQSTAMGTTSLAANMIGSPTHLGYPGWTDLDGILVTSAAGTLAATIGLATGGDNVTTYAGSWLRVTQLA